MSTVMLMTTSTLKTTTQAAERLGVTVVTIRRWTEDGRLTAAQRLDNGLYLFDDAEIERAVASRVAELRTELSRLTRCPS